MKETAFYSCAYLLVGVFLVVLFSVITSPGSIVSSADKASCMEGALYAREGFKGTDFEDWNFYESCLLNIACANPDKPCPKQEIHEHAKVFLTRSE